LRPRAQATFADPGWPAQDQIVVRLDPFAGGKLLKQGAVEAARCALIATSSMTAWWRNWASQSSGQALVAAMNDLAIDEQAELVGMGQHRPVTGGFEFGEGLRHA